MKEILQNTFRDIPNSVRYEILKSPERIKTKKDGWGEHVISEVFYNSNNEVVLTRYGIIIDSHPLLHLYDCGVRFYLDSDIERTSN